MKNTEVGNEIGSSFRETHLLFEKKKNPAEGKALTGDIKLSSG